MSGVLRYVRKRSISYTMGSGSSSDQSDQPRTIVVFGATGLLGGAVARALLKDPLRYRVRAATRRPSSDEARKLAEDGAVIVTAKLDDVQSLEKALTGAHGMFLTTHYWEDKNKEKEIVRGLNAIDAAVNLGVKEIIFNGSENIKKLTGKDCGQLDAKAAIEEYIREVGINYTIVRLPFWYENFTSVFRPHKLKDGSFAIALPLDETAMDAICVEDAGRCIATIFDKSKNYSQKIVGLTAGKLTVDEIVRSFNKHIPETKFSNPKIRVKDFERFDFPGASDLAAMFEFYQRGELERDFKLTKKLCPYVKTFDTWLSFKKNTDKLKEVLEKSENSEGEILS